MQQTCTSNLDKLKNNPLSLNSYKGLLRNTFITIKPTRDSDITTRVNKNQDNVIVP